MKLVINDLIKIIILAFSWFLVKNYCLKNDYNNLSEALNYVPIHIIITLGYYAGISVCINVMNIKNCEKEYSELICDIDEARRFYDLKKLNYN